MSSISDAALTLVVSGEVRQQIRWADVREVEMLAAPGTSSWPHSKLRTILKGPLSHGQGDSMSITQTFNKVAGIAARIGEEARRRPDLVVHRNVASTVAAELSRD